MILTVCSCFDKPINVTAQSILLDTEVLSNYCAVIVLSTKVMILIRVMPNACV